MHYVIAIPHRSYRPGLRGFLVLVRLMNFTMKSSCGSQWVPILHVPFCNPHPSVSGSAVSWFINTNLQLSLTHKNNKRLLAKFVIKTVQSRGTLVQTSGKYTTVMTQNIHRGRLYFPCLSFFWGASQLKYRINPAVFDEYYASLSLTGMHLMLKLHGVHNESSQDLIRSIEGIVMLRGFVRNP